MPISSEHLDWICSTSGLLDEPKIIAETPYSLVALIQTHAGPAYFKAYPSALANEPAYVETLWTIAPNLVPKILASNRALNCMLSAPCGQPHWLCSPAPAPSAFLASSLRAYRRLQTCAQPIAPKLRAHGIPARDPRRFSELFDQAFEECFPAHPEKTKISRLVLKSCALWKETNLPLELDHGDANLGNFLCGRSGAPTFIDWGEASFAHPMFAYYSLRANAAKFSSRETLESFDSVLPNLFPEWSAELRDNAFSTGRDLAPAQKFIGIAILMRTSPEAAVRFGPKALEAFASILHDAA